MTDEQEPNSLKHTKRAITAALLGVGVMISQIVYLVIFKPEASLVEASVRVLGPALIGFTVMMIENHEAELAEQEHEMNRLSQRISNLRRRK